MADTAALELICGRCGALLMRWQVDLGVPFEKVWDGERVSAQIEAPGGYRRASDGKWYRWAPGPAAGLPDGQTWTRYKFPCPDGCRTSPQARVGKLEDAAGRVLRRLHDTRTPLLRMTVDRLLRLPA